jgi:hypothetical protein
MSWNIVQSNITTQEAENEFPNDHIVLLAPWKDDDEGVTGDVIFVGTALDAYACVRGMNPPDGFIFYHLRGVNLREMAPIEVV